MSTDTLQDVETSDLNHLQEYVFLVPLDAPLPLELADAVLTTGPLLHRLAPLAEVEHKGLALVPISGSELLALERAWPLIQQAKRVALLTELPGARYDVLLTQAKRHIGLRAIDWPSIATFIEGSARQEQRIKDKTPWASTHRGSNLKDAERTLTRPPEGDTSENPS